MMLTLLTCLLLIGVGMCPNGESPVARITYTYDGDSWQEVSLEGLTIVKYGENGMVVVEDKNSQPYLLSVNKLRRERVAALDWQTTATGFVCRFSGNDLIRSIWILGQDDHWAIWVAGPDLFLPTEASACAAKRAAKTGSSASVLRS